MNILTINASARLAGSNSRATTGYLTERLAAQPGAVAVERDLVASPLPPITPAELMAVHGSQPLTADSGPSLAAHLALSDQLIDELRQASVVVVGAPMYNFALPTYLKQWVDYVCRAGVSFRYGASGPEGLLAIDHAVIVTASGGTPVGGALDYISGYLEQIFGFVGAKQVHHIDVGGSKRTPEQVIEGGRAQVDRLLATTLLTGW